MHEIRSGDGRGRGAIPPAPRSKALSPFSVAAAYALLGSMWIVLSDLAVSDAEPFGPSTVKGLAFVAVTASFLLLVLRRWERRLVQEVERRSQRDDLTGLANRSTFTRTLARALTGEGRRRAVGVCLIGLDRFTMLNDSLGHAVGDDLLRAVAGRLVDGVGPDRAARLGGDRFLALLVGDDDNDLIAQAAGLLQHAAAPVDVGEERYLVGATAGLAASHPREDEPDAARLLSAADAALRHAKAQARGGVIGFSPEMGLEAIRFLETQRHLDTALHDGRIQVAFQPEVDLPTGSIAGVEALVRVPTETGEVLPASDVVQVAEETGRIGALTWVVLRQAATAAAEWSSAGLLPDGARVWVNVSARQLLDADLLEEVLGLLDEVGCPTAVVGLEVTESVAVQDAVLRSGVLRSIQAAGLALAIDDFGTGYSSLAALAQLEVDMLKLDRVLVVDMAAGNPTALGIVRAVANLTRDLGLGLIAEGVEAPDEARALVALGCTWAQGYLVCRPAPCREVTAVLERARSADGPWW